MTIQIKRGNTADRPNPLLNGEFGWDADTRRLWIGNGVVNENLFVAGAAVSTDFSIYVCTTTLGGGAADADGLAKNSGTATATSANKLVDAAASFDSSYVNKTVYNITDDTWAKITAVDSATQLSLSANIMATGESYETTNAFATVPAGFAAVPGPYSANVTLRISPGTFTEDVTFIGKIAAGSKTLTVAGSTTGTTTITGAVEISQKITINNITFSGTTINANYGAEVTWSNCPLANTRLNTRNGSDLTWDNCDGSGTTKLYTYLGSKNLIENTAVTVGNNPENLTSINSTITRGYTIYVATTALGGNDAVADGLAITSGTATSTTANKLVDSGAAFTSALVGKTVYNSTDDTWAKVNAVDSATQLSLSADIMASGEAYVIADAFSTIQGGINAIPGAVNSDTTVKISNGTFDELPVVQGKIPTGTYTITLAGTWALSKTGTVTSGTTGTGSTQGTLTDTGGGLSAYGDKMVYVNGVYRIIDSATATVLTLIECPDVTPSGTYKVYDWGTVVVQGWQIAPSQTAVELQNMKLTGLFLVKVSASVICRRLLLQSTTAQNHYSDNFSNATFYNCLSINTASGSYGLWLNMAYGFIIGCKIESAGVGGFGVRHAGGYALMRNGTKFTGWSIGYQAEGNCFASFYSAAGDGYVFVTNCTTGIKAIRGGQAIATATNVYSGNTTNESAETVSYGYID